MELDPLASRLDSRIKTLDEDLALAVRAQSQQAGKALDDLDKAKNAVGELHAKVKGIRGKAEDSEKRVKAVCSDITLLDRAKTNLQNTMKTLTKAAQLLTTLDQLEFFTISRQYNDAAAILVAVNELNDFFTPQENVPKVYEMRQMVARVKDTLTKNVFEDFEQGLGEVWELHYDHDKATRLQGACAVANLLSRVTRQGFKKKLVDNYLHDYDEVFREDSPEMNSMEHADKRFAWIKKLLEDHGTMIDAVFPPEWRLDEAIAYAFSVRTAAQFTRMFETDTWSVPHVVKAVKVVNRFEASMSEHFARIYPSPSASMSPSADQMEEKGGSGAQHERSRRASSAGTEPDDNAAIQWKGVISTLFMPYMGKFVQLVSATMHTEIRSAMTEELVEQASNRDGSQSSLKVFPSSATLFTTMKKSNASILECSNRQPFADMCLAYKVHLTQYKEDLESRVIPSEKSNMTAAPTSGVIPPGFAARTLDVQAVIQLCLAINTADYISAELPRVQSTCQKNADPAFAEKINFERECDMFSECASRVLNSLATRLVQKLDSNVGEMTKINWLTFQNAGDLSVYVREFQATLRDFVPAICSTVDNPIYFRMFVDSFASIFLKSLQVIVFKIRRVGEAGAQQLYVDMDALEATLLDVPLIGTKSGKAMSQAAQMTYKRFVENAMRRHKMLFKYLSLKSAAVEDFSRLLGQSASITLYNQVLDLRGIFKPLERVELIRHAREGGVPDTVPEDAVAEAIRIEAGVSKEPPPPPPPLAPPVLANVTASLFGTMGKSTMARSGSAATPVAMAPPAAVLAPPPAAPKVAGGLASLFPIKRPIAAPAAAPAKPAQPGAR